MSVAVIGDRCCGCMACKQSCEFNAIVTVNDKYGFEQIKVNSELCTECKLCENVCPALNDIEQRKILSSGAAYALDNDIKLKGSSGGLFGTLAKKIISDGGVVFGAAFDENLNLRTVGVSSQEELSPLYKSKYLLCDTNDKFKEIKKLLEKKKTVLYCSSPCQIAALKRFLENDYENLVTVDFVCHGVGSQDLFNRSCEWVEKRKSAKIKSFEFRYKSEKKATSHYYKYTFEKNGVKRESVKEYLFFPFYYAHQKRLAYREACYSCKFASENRVSDITIGDFHTIEKYERSIDRFAGVSMYVINTDKGRKLFDSVKLKLFVKGYDWEIIKRNNRFGGVEVSPTERKKFLNSINKEPFEKTVQKFLNPYKDWRLIYYRMPSAVRNLLKKKLGR